MSLDVLITCFVVRKQLLDDNLRAYLSHQDKSRKVSLSSLPSFLPILHTMTHIISIVLHCFNRCRMSEFPEQGKKAKRDKNRMTFRNMPLLALLARIEDDED